MKSRPTALVLSAAVAALAAGCTGGSIDPGDPVDYALACGTTTTHAEVAQLSPQQLIVGDFVSGLGLTATGVHGGYVPIAVDPSMPIYAPGTRRTIYLNRDGATITAGMDDASRNSSSVLANGPPTATIPKAQFSDADWLKVVSCIRDEFFRFNVQMVTERPSTPGYMMAMIGGKAADAGLPMGVGGVAPIDSMGCRVIENAIVYAFSESVGNGVMVTCEVAAQEIAHAFSLDHELLASDPMTYLMYSGHKTFQDMDVDCGESVPRPCNCQRPSQNSVKILSDKAGLFLDPDGPVVSIVSPEDGTMQAPGELAITVHATSPKNVARVTLNYHDASNFIVAHCSSGSIDCTRSGDNYIFRVPNANGLATFFAEAADVPGNTNVTHINTIALGSTTPASGAIKINVSVDTSSLRSRGPVIVNAAITSSAGTIPGATLHWTDRRGVVADVPMCAGAMNTWTHAEQVAHLSGDRYFVVEASDSAGNHAASSRFTIIADF